jgi:hypothetical protein
MQNSSSGSGGIGFGGLLTLIFIVLKLTGSINWSWWWVLSPILIPIAIVWTIVLAGIVFTGLLKLHSWILS